MIATGPDAETGYRPVQVAAEDGLALFARDYGERWWSTTPVLCLPGLARTSADFHELALHLSCDAATPRRVVACDMRGRGRSGYDRDPGRYELPTECRDILAIAAALGLGKTFVIGASRGGLQAMLLNTMRPAMAAGIVLIDVGPVLEGKGLARIKAYLGKLPPLRDHAEAATLLRRLGEAQFPAWSEEQWRRMAQRGFKATSAGLVPDYDPKLALTLAGIDLEAPLPTLWPLFDALAHLPMLAVRGQNSDILSAATLAEMTRRHPGCESIVVPGEGHVPDVGAPELRDNIAAFLARHDQAAAR